MFNNDQTYYINYRARSHWLSNSRKSMARVAISFIALRIPRVPR